VVDELLFGGGGEFGKLGRIENGEVAALGIGSEFRGVRFFGFKFFFGVELGRGVFLLFRGTNDAKIAIEFSEGTAIGEFKNGFEDDFLFLLRNLAVGQQERLTGQIRHSVGFGNQLFGEAHVTLGGAFRERARSSGKVLFDPLSKEAVGERGFGAMKRDSGEELVAELLLGGAPSVLVIGTNESTGFGEIDVAWHFEFNELVHHGWDLLGSDDSEGVTTMSCGEGGKVLGLVKGSTAAKRFSMAAMRASSCCLRVGSLVKAGEARLLAFLRWLLAIERGSAACLNMRRAQSSSPPTMARLILRICSLTLFFPSLTPTV
jgi:hypothetical protein